MILNNLNTALLNYSRIDASQRETNSGADGLLRGMDLTLRINSTSAPPS
jgi:hypothetical protein